MIAMLRGRIWQLNDDHVIIDANGVGYAVYCSGKTLAQLPSYTGQKANDNEAITLRIETNMRENAITLYGFADKDEQEWFAILQKVQGVGARMALALLSVLQPAEIAQAILDDDSASLSRANGVGARLAKRIISELKDKIDLPETVASMAQAASATAGTEANPTQVSNSNNSSADVKDAISALQNLGYSKSEAATCARAALKELGHGAKTEDIIRYGLQQMSRA
jgi:Holliday junction DNA helicase RuvA